MTTFPFARYNSVSCTPTPAMPMTLSTHYHRSSVWLLLLGTACLSFWQLGHLPLLDSDEPVYGEVGKLMAASHSFAFWLTPHYNGGLWFDKPPLFYWLTAFSMTVFGATEFAARLPSALESVGLVAVTFALARHAYPALPAAAFWSGFVLATCVQFFLLARAAVTDMTLALLLTLAVLGMYAWLAENQACWIVLSGVATGLACLAKGPVALVLIGLQLLLYLALTRRWVRLASPALWGSFIGCLAIALPWFLAMIHLHGDVFIQGFLQANNVTRYLQPEHKETQAVYWYVPVFLGFFLPWTVAVPGALVAVVRRNREERIDPQSPRPTLFLGVWCALVLLFFSVSQTKLTTYIFPLFPVMAVLAGVWVFERLHAPVAASQRTLKGFAVLMTLLAAALAVLGKQYHVAPGTVGLWLMTLLAGTFVCLFGSSQAARWLAPGLATGLVLLVVWSSPTWRTRASDVSERQLAHVADVYVPPGQPIYALTFKHPSLVFYSNRRVFFTDDHDHAVQDMAAHPDHIYATKVRDFHEMQAHYNLSHIHVLYTSRTSCLLAGRPALLSIASPTITEPQPL